MNVVGLAAGAALLAAGAIGGTAYDFGLLDFYHPMKPALPGQIKIACVGDSITFGCMVQGWRRNSYPAVLGRLLGDGFCVNNFGYTDRTATNGGEKPYVGTKLYRDSLAWQPDHVFLLLGSNDSKEKVWNRAVFLQDYGAIVESYLALPSHPRVYLMTPLPLFPVGGKVRWQLRQEVVDREIRPAIQAIARDRGLPCIDLYPVFSGKRELFVDGVHPNRNGSALLARTVLETYRQENPPYRFYGWEWADCRPIGSAYPGIGSPRDLYDRLGDIWCAETCAPRLRGEWTRENKTLGQCSITAFLVQDIFGGKVCGIPLGDGNFHCYNVIGDRCFDLTSEQFGDKKLDYRDNPEQFREIHFAREEKRLRYELLKKMLKER